MEQGINGNATNTLNQTIIIEIIKVVVSIIEVAAPIICNMIKNRHDEKVRDENSICKIRKKPFNTFDQLIIQVWWRLAFSLGLTVIFQAILNLCKQKYQITIMTTCWVNIAKKIYENIIIMRWMNIWNKYLEKIVLVQFFVLISIIVTLKTDKKILKRIKYAEKRTEKMTLLLSNYIIFIMIFCTGWIEMDYLCLYEIGLTVVVVIWAAFLIKVSNATTIIYHKYADIYLKTGGKIERIQTYSIKKEKEIVTMLQENDEKEIHIREEDIRRVDYYGEPICKVRKGIHDKAQILYY